MAKVTVLMPVYNAEKFLSEAIESILGQSFSDFEFLIIDDGSTDNSIDIIHSYKDDRIHLFRNKRNMGISKTLNMGIEMAGSDLIARMDADDISLADRLNKQYNFMHNHPEYCFVSSDVEKISANGKTLRKSGKKKSSGSKFFYYNLTFHCYGIYHPAVMYRKKPVQDVGMYPETLSEDYRLWSKLIRKYPFFHIPETLVKYRITNQSISHEHYFKEYRDAEKIYIIDNLKYFVGEDYSIPDSWLEAYRNNFDPLCHPKKINEMARCIRELEVITSHILAKENVNRNPKAIKLASEQKKKHLLRSFLRQISAFHKLQLIIMMGNYEWQVRLLITGLFRRLKKLIAQIN